MKVDFANIKNWKIIHEDESLIDALTRIFWPILKFYYRYKSRRYPMIFISPCKHDDVYHDAICSVGSYYCHLCNAIYLCPILYTEKEFEKSLVSILIHESIHWCLCMHVNEEASSDLDRIVPKEDDTEVFF
jgi:hypothetical protein